MQACDMNYFGMQETFAGKRTASVIALLLGLSLQPAPLRANPDQPTPVQAESETAAPVEASPAQDDDRGR